MNSKTSESVMDAVAALLAVHGAEAVLLAMRGAADAVADHFTGCPATAKQERAYKAVSLRLRIAAAAVARAEDGCSATLSSGADVLADIEHEQA